MPDTSSLGDSQGVIGLSFTALLGILSWWNLRRGQKDTHELAADAQDLQRERFDQEQQRETIATLREEIVRLTAARDADQARCDQTIARLETRHTAERATCVRVTGRLHEDLLATAAVLRSEIDAASARDSAHLAETHLRFEHGEADDSPS